MLAVGGGGKEGDRNSQVNMHFRRLRCNELQIAAAQKVAVCFHFVGKLALRDTRESKQASERASERAAAALFNNLRKPAAKSVAEGGFALLASSLSLSLC